MDFTVIRKYAVRFVGGSRAPLAVSAFSPVVRYRTLPRLL